MRNWIFAQPATDRKSTRLNSSHTWISYAVFCLKKKKYTIIFEIAWRDSESGKTTPHEYRKKPQMTISDARAYARRLSNTQNVISVLFYKQMF